jgi:superfamily II DNA or RNA helicase
VEHIKDFLSRGGSARILVGDYLDVTEPVALRRLADLEGDLTLRIFVTDRQGFHLKTYIFLTDDEGVAFVGSSNISQAALTDSIEWNYKVISIHDTKAFSEITSNFEELFNSDGAVAATPEWISQYEDRRTEARFQEAGLPFEIPQPKPEPHAIQTQALAALNRTRQDGYTAGLVVLATGLGKTWLAAFDSNGADFRRILFIAHREEILDQAIETFRQVHPAARIGRMSGDNKDFQADLLFASVQTLSRATHLRNFTPDAFDYIVVDEFHHAAASTYRRIINYFEPKFLLGLTATPERSDGADLLALCQENLVFQADITVGIDGGHLCPFHYFGVPDEVDYRNIPWRNSQFDITELTAAIATEVRAENALDQFKLRGGSRCIGFCCSQTHADFMADFFNARGIKAVAVHSGSRSAPRTSSLKALARGEIEVVFSVDMFNEGVDVPNIDTVLMLRPTESTIIWLQQLGRGLRRSKEKEKLVVIDYIGNHRIFLTKLRALASIAGRDGTSYGQIREFLKAVRTDSISLPADCEITYDLATVDILTTLLRPSVSESAMEGFYRDFLERHGLRPTATETFHAGINPRSSSEHSWLAFVDRMGGLTSEERVAWQSARSLLEELEQTALTKSYKLVVLFVLLYDETLDFSLSIDELTASVSRFASRTVKVRGDFSIDVKDLRALKALLLKYPIEALCSLTNEKGENYFSLSENFFRLEKQPADRENFLTLAREILDWRLAQYLYRSGARPGNREFICRVSRNSSGQPILFLSSSAEAYRPGEGETSVRINEQLLLASVAKIAINVIRETNDGPNLLPGILRKWFGDDAGQPGRTDRVRFTEINEVWQAEPMTATVEKTSGLRLWERYTRDVIPPAFGFEFSKAVWETGFVAKEPHIFLLVTLDKSGMTNNHRYSDHFNSPTEFYWQSQNRTTQASRHGQMISNHRALGLHVHLLVRKTKKIGSKPAPFIYCGEVDFVSWEGQAPISVTWQLREALPSALYDGLKRT